ncbi:MAG TPA: glycosyltransferase family 4 protein [Solirubrobacteraceae bacterium]|nr:glycosyltransferase family 4 protein [Solirubrobacteraceae bacterium]
MAVHPGPRGERSAASAAGPSAGERASELTIVAHDIGPVGGMERVLSELIIGLRERGHEVTVIARTCELPAAAAGVRFHRVRGPARPFMLAYPWFLLAGSWAVLRHARGILQVTGGLVLVPADVVSVHYCHQVGPASPSRGGPLYRANISLVRVAKRVSERVCFYINRKATFVCVSEGVADEVRRHYPRLAGRVMTIHNGVDTERFRPGRLREEAAALRERLGLAAEEPVALFVGGEWERKGLRLVIEALAGAPEWALVVAGDGDRARYEGLARSLRVAERVRWLGVQRDVAPLYELADAFVMPTSYETFSLVTFEAAAAGLPLLATPVSGINELLQDGRNGFLVERSGESIAARLRLLAADSARTAELGAAAREAAMRFSWGRTVERHHKLYRRLAGELGVPSD